MGLYGNGMHFFILMEMELGTRVAMAQDSEDCGWSALWDLSYELYLNGQGAAGTAMLKVEDVPLETLNLLTGSVHEPLI